jgi:hypothetical protein
MSPEAKAQLREQRKTSSAAAFTGEGQEAESGELR